MTSLWLTGRADQPLAPSPLDTGARSADVAVVGAGITGLITAVLLARAGRNVLVLEANSLGAGATGNTTAKISLLQGTKLSKIVGKHGPKVARGVRAGQPRGPGVAAAVLRSHGVAVQREDAYTYAQSEQGVASAREELEACTAAGLDAEWVDDADVPFPFRGGVRLRRAGAVRSDAVAGQPRRRTRASAAAGSRRASASRKCPAHGDGLGFTCAPPPARSSTSSRGNACWRPAFRSWTAADSLPGSSPALVLHGVPGARQHHVGDVHLDRFPNPVGAIRAEHRTATV